MTDRLIPLTKGYSATISGHRWGELSRFTWAVTDDKGHGRRYAFRYASAAERKAGAPRRIKMHRHILQAPQGMAVDHRNHDGLDNRDENIRLCTHADNKRNVRHLRGTSRFKGVYWEPRRRCWASSITRDRQFWLGYFDDEEDAATVYNVAAQLFYGEFAHLNTI